MLTAVWTACADIAPPPPRETTAPPPEKTAPAEKTDPVPAASEPAKPEPGDGKLAKVMVIPVRSEINEPALYVLRRGLKAAIDQGMDTVVLDMETPGGRVDVTFEILQALEKFPGRTITYVNNEAISAGALISAGTDDIWFAKNGVIGAAAPVNAAGTDIGDTMHQKVVSYLKARVRSVSEGRGYRGEVVSAMIDRDFELKIGDAVLKPKGELLSLTASEAMKTYGEPPVPLLGAGIAPSIDAVLDKVHGSGNWTLSRTEPTWSEGVAQYLAAWAPILMGLGMICLFIEFKTPGFGIFGVLGILALAAVFFGNWIAGLSGHEPAMFFVIGLLLLALEIFVFPGTIIVGIAGLALMLGSLVWSMADLWPQEPISFSADVFLQPLASVAAGGLIALVGIMLALRFLPGRGPWERLVLKAAIAGDAAGISSLAAAPETTADPLVGRDGVAATALFPSGQVEIDGRRYEARLAVGFAEAGTRVTVRRRSEFGLEVEVLAC